MNKKQKYLSISYLIVAPTLLYEGMLDGLMT